MKDQPSTSRASSLREATLQRIEELFVRALGLEESRVAAFLAEEESDVALREEVAALVRAHYQAGDFLEAPLLAEHWATQRPFLGRRLGAWRLEREIGRGGMSSVYLGLREVGDFEQQVAIKVADQGYAGKLFEARLAEERRFLSRLDHPGIARLLDGGSTEEGIPYLVMELVAGEPIDEYCASRRLDLDSRLELFLAVLDAVDFAHRALIVHRDLKPAHVLVDDKGNVKLLDFGIAKLLEPLPGNEAADLTRGGLFAAFTPNYASPEQFRRETITTATDVYSLGVLLYRVLTGELPRRIESLTSADVEAAFAAEPLPPSRWGLAGSPAGKRTTLPQDLDAILHRALEATPTNRYPSAAALADDLRRLRSGHPVLARRPTVFYKLRLAIGRHRLAAALWLFALITLGAFLLHARNQAIAVATERDRAVDQGIKAEVAAAFLGEILAEADPQRSGGQVLLRDALDKGAQRLHEKKAGSLRERHVMVMTMGAVYRSVGAYSQARPLLEESLELARRGQDPLALAKSLFELATWEAEAGTQDKSTEFHRRALTLRRKHLPPGHPDLLASIEGLARQLSWNFGTAETIELQKEALEQRRSRGENALLTLGNQARLSRSLTELDRFEEGCALAQETLGQFPATDPSQLTSAGLLAIGTSLLNCGEGALAEQTLRRALAQLSQSKNYLFKDYTLNDLALTLLQQGRIDEAAAAFEESRNDLMLKVGADSWPVAIVTSNLAEARRAQGRLEESAELYRRAIDRFGKDKSLGGLAEARYGLGLTLLAMGRPEAAREELEASLAIWTKWLPPGHSRIWEAEGALGKVLIAEGREDEGQRRFAAAENAILAILGEDHPRTRQLRRLSP